MPTPPSTDNYQVGGLQIIVGGIDLGNIVSAQEELSVSTLQHFTARSGARQLDKEIVTEKTYTIRVTLDEHHQNLHALYYMGEVSGTNVIPLTQPLTERNIVMTWLNENGDITEYSHTRCNVKPAGPRDYGEFNDWNAYELLITLLEDQATPSTPFGTITGTWTAG